MKNLLLVLLGVVAVIAISATTASMITVKPAQPRETVAFLTTTETMNRRIPNVTTLVSEYSKKGYRVKDIYSNGVSQHHIIVMEKY